MQEVTYAILDKEGVMINSVIAIKDDFETLDKIKETHKADSYREIDPEIYIVRPNFLYWNGTNWDKISNK